MTQCESHSFILTKKYVLARRHQEQRGPRAVGGRQAGQLHQMPFGFVEDEFGDVKQRVGPLRLLHRLHHSAEPLFFWLKRDFKGEGGCRGRVGRPAILLVSSRCIVPLWGATPTLVRARSAAIARGGRSWRARTIVPVPVTIPARSSVVASRFALRSRVIGVRLARGLDPLGGQRQFFERQGLILCRCRVRCRWFAVCHGNQRRRTITQRAV